MASKATTDSKPAGAMGLRNNIEPGGPFPPEAGRYHLYISYGCPFACRCLAVLYLKGLEDVIGVSVTHPTMQRTRPNNPEDKHIGWAFVNPTDPPLPNADGLGAFSCDGCVPDTAQGAKFVRDLYEMAKDTSGKYSVPVLWDKKQRTIVNNESPEIMRIFNSAFNDLAKNPAVDLYPEALRPAIDEVGSWVQPGINMAVYRCGFAPDQKAYEQACEELFASLDRAESTLSRQRYLAGDVLTEVDIKLFMTLIRFDEAYYILYKACKKLIRDYPNLCNYMRELYQMPALRRTVNMDHIRVSYFSSQPKLNPGALVPVPGEAWWEQPHDRAARFGGPAWMRGVRGAAGRLLPAAARGPALGAVSLAAGVLAGVLAGRKGSK